MDIMDEFNDEFNECLCFDESKGRGRYLDGWEDALRNIVHLIENEYDLSQIEHFCRKEYENYEG